MKEHVCANKNGSRIQTLLTFFSIPWCRVISITLVLIATSGSVLGIIFDEWFHGVMPVVLSVLIPMHLFGIYRHIKHSHRTHGQTLFIVATTVLFIVSIGFHFTDLHDSFF